VIGRKVEDQILNKALDLFKAHGCRRIGAEFIPTQKNHQVAAFYESHGFSLIAEEQDGRKIYERMIE